MVDKDVPLCVDLDGTLIRSDLLHEALIGVAKTRPLGLLNLFTRLGEGKAMFKQKVSGLCIPDPTLLPYRPEVIAQIEAARANGRSTVLCTASPQPFAEAVSKHLGIFDQVMASSPETNLASHEKARVLEERFGIGNFDYIGNSNHDLAVFKKCRRAFLVSSHDRLRQRSIRENGSVEFLDDDRPTFRTWLKAIRAHQWVKNVLVFVPVVAAHAVTELDKLIAVIAAFLSFSLCASAIYLANDLVDLSADRAHRSKRCRPLAAGMISVPMAVSAILLLFCSAILIASFLPPLYIGILLGYVSVNIAYSFWLKRQVIVDVVILASLYTFRILAGSAATLIAPSFWLLGFSVFIFLCLAFVKRVSELQRTVGRGRPPGRGYLASDLPVLFSLGTASGMVSVLVLALYMQSEAFAFAYPGKPFLWLVPPIVLYWISRLWMKTNRDEIHDDPIVFAIKDWQSLISFFIISCLFILASTYSLDIS